MNHLSVNGMELSLPVEPNAPLQELLEYLRKNLASEKVTISAVHVNGSELSTDNEAQLATVPVSEIQSVEIFTFHSREIVQDTLQNLLEYSSFLENLSKSTAGLLFRPEDKKEFFTCFGKLIDGISVFTEAVTQVKKALKIGILPPIPVLEADLLSILKDILACQKSGQGEYMQELLLLHLPKNLQQWKQEGLPVLIRSRDC